MTDLYAPPEKKARSGNMTLRLGEELLDAFQAHCRKHGLSASEVVKRFIRNELEKAALQTSSTKGE